MEETPLECTECGLQFKTRETYKQHLKRGHENIPSASAIQEDKNSQVETKPYLVYKEATDSASPSPSPSPTPLDQDTVESVHLVNPGEINAICHQTLSNIPGIMYIIP